MRYYHIGKKLIDLSALQIQLQIELPIIHLLHMYNISW